MAIDADKIAQDAINAIAEKIKNLKTLNIMRNRELCDLSRNFRLKSQANFRIYFLLLHFAIENAKII